MRKECTFKFRRMREKNIFQEIILLPREIILKYELFEEKSAWRRKASIAPQVLLSAEDQLQNY